MARLSKSKTSALHLLNKRPAIYLDASATRGEAFLTSGGPRGINWLLRVTDLLVTTGAALIMATPAPGNPPGIEEKEA